MDFKLKGIKWLGYVYSTAYVWNERYEKYISKLNGIDMNGLISHDKIRNRTSTAFGKKQIMRVFDKRFLW